MVNFEVVGLSGKAGSGKDYIAQNYLIPLGYSQFSFAWHFKVWIVGSGQATWDEVFVTKPYHIRKLLQEEGTERGRNVYGENVWCETAGVWMRVLAENSGITKFVIPDVRFPNEVEFVQSLGGRVWKINAPERVANSNLSEDQRQHISETALDNFTGFDAVVQNDPWYADSVQSQVFAHLNLL